MGKESFEHKTGEEPHRCVVKANDSFYVEFGFAVVPGTGLVFFEQGTGEEFCDENQNRIKASPQQDRKMFDFVEHRGEECGGAVDGEHPEGGHTG